MKQQLVINAATRSERGKGASRRLRRADIVPGILYGANKAATMLAITHKTLTPLLNNEAFYTQILELKLADSSELVILRDLQRHPFKPKVLHIDLQRINPTEKLIMRIPLHFTGAELAPGVKIGGGVISHLMPDIEVRCLPQDLPEAITIDLSTLELNQAIHMSELKLPPGVEIMALVHGEDKPVVTLNLPRTKAEEEEGAVAPTAVPLVGEEAAKGTPEESPKGK